MNIDMAEFPNLKFEKAIIKTDLAGIIKDWSSNAEKLLGFSEKEIIGQNISSIFSGERFTSESIKIPLLGKNEKNFFEAIAYTRLNRKILLGIESSPVINENGDTNKICYSLTYNFGENAFEVKEAIIEALVNSSDDGIISKTLEGIITSWNPAATRMFGYSEKEILGKHISLIIPPDRLEEEEFIIKNTRAGQKIDHFETVRIAKDGTERNVELSISPIIARNGKIIGISKILRDISFKKEIEERKAILAAIVDSSDDAIISKTINGVITSWNQAAHAMFGYTEEEAIGKHISIIIPRERIEEETIIIENIRKGNKVDHFETERITKDGVIKNISVTVSPIKNSKGEIIGASKTARDITLKIEAEKQRALYTEGLKELNIQKDEFMVMASHELKTPITVLLANLHILQLLLQGDSNNEFVEKTLKQTMKLSSLIENMFEVSKIQAGRLVLNITSFDIDVLIKEVISDMQQTTAIHRINYTGKPGTFISADSNKIEQVIVNLLSNAIKYMTEAGEINIQLDQKDDQITFGITDSGVGIPEKDIKNIFQRFYRVSGLASSFSGSGVGLYISSEIIKAHDGKIWAESELGTGTTFYFSVPGK